MRDAPVKSHAFRYLVLLLVSMGAASSAASGSAQASAPTANVTPLPDSASPKARSKSIGSAGPKKPTRSPARTISATPSRSPFFNGHFSTGNLSQWPNKEGMNLSTTPPGVSVVSTPAGYAAKVIVEPSFTSASGSGPSTTMWEGSGTNTYNLPWQQAGSNTWFHARYLFPDGTAGNYPGKFTPMPTAGYAADWDVLMEWHSAPGAGYSTYIGVYGPGKGLPPHLELHPVGNDTQSTYIETNQTQTKIPGRCLPSRGSPAPTHRRRPRPRAHRKQVKPPSPCGHRLPLKYNHWYDILVRVKFSTDPTVGRIDWYVDGNLRFSDSIATMNKATDGTTPGVAFENGLYRDSGTTQTDTIYIQGIKVGPTRGSVSATNPAIPRHHHPPGRR
jgi:hypothetical protein